MLKSENPIVRRAGVFLLLFSRANTRISLIKSCLNDDNYDVRTMAVYVLSVVEPDEGTRVLLCVLTDRSVAVDKEYAAEVLSRVVGGGKVQFGVDAEKWRAWWNGRIAQNMIEGGVVDLRN